MPELPLKAYATFLSNQTFLLISSFLFLPRSTVWLLGPAYAPQQTSSPDRPEHPFLTSLTAQPLATMAWDVAGMLLSMLWWSGKMKTWWAMPPGNASGRPGPSYVRDAILATVGGAFLILPLLLLMGAPLDGHFLRSILFSLHLSVLLVWPITQTIGLPSMYDAGIVQRYQLTRLFCQFRAETPLERALAYPALGAIVGAWFGVLPLALDWDRPWQNYPLTLTFGSILGFLAGGWISFLRSAAEAAQADQSTGAVEKPKKQTRRTK